MFQDPLSPPLGSCQGAGPLGKHPFPPLSFPSCFPSVREFIFIHSEDWRLFASSTHRLPFLYTLPTPRL